MNENGATMTLHASAERLPFPFNRLRRNHRRKPAMPAAVRGGAAAQKTLARIADGP
jgi:hypothetical protein